MAAGEGENEIAKSQFEQQAAEAAKRGERGGTEGFSSYRPLEVLTTKRYETLQAPEKTKIKEALRETILGPFQNFSRSINAVVEAVSAKKRLYSGESGLEREEYSVSQTETLIQNAIQNHEDDEKVVTGDNDILLGAVLREQIRHEAVQGIYNWALPYLATYWGGIDSLKLLSERGMQLSMGTLARFYKGPAMAWVENGLRRLGVTNPEVVQAIPLAKKEKGVAQIEPDKQVETAALKETFGDRLARYTSDADFWTRVRGEMNTYNPTLGGKEKEVLQISPAMQEFVAELSLNQPRTKEDGSKERRALPKKLTLYFDANGRQIVQDAFDEDGNQITTKEKAEEIEKMGGKIILRLPPGVTYDKKVEMFADNLDYFNKSKSEQDRRWVVATTMAMCLMNAKEILDGLPRKINTDDSDPIKSKIYRDLREEVNKLALDIMANFDSPRNLEQQMAKTAFNLAYAISFGSMSVGDIGWSNEWKWGFDDKTKKFRWEAEPSQGDPTASGDAFTARFPYFHEVMYVIKNRVNSMNSGAMMGVDGAKALEFANALVSEVEEANQRGVMVEILKQGKQRHLTKFYGVLGAYPELGALDENKKPLNPLAYEAWKAGEAIRIKAGKTANPNLLRTIEESVMYVPTPFKNGNGETLYYPMIMPQFKISLFDMLSVGKDVSAGDLMRKTWKTDSNGMLVETTPDDKDGRRITQREIDWMMYGAYSEDGRAVNDNFISQLYVPLYGALNPKNVEAMESSPMAAITGIIKAVDIGTRNFIKKLKGGGTSKRQSFETMYASAMIFQNLALGVHNVIGRGGIKNFEGFIEDIAPGKGKDRKPNNLYTVLRTVSDFLKNKQGYDNYEGGFYLSLLAQAEAIKPIVISADMMASRTTLDMLKKDLVSSKIWAGVVEDEQKVATPEMTANLNKYM